MASSSTHRQYRSTYERPCVHCGNIYRSKGLGRHEKACKANRGLLDDINLARRNIQTNEIASHDDGSSDPPPESDIAPDESASSSAQEEAEDALQLDRSREQGPNFDDVGRAQEFELQVVVEATDNIEHRDAAEHDDEELGNEDEPVVRVDRDSTSGAEDSVPPATGPTVDPGAGEIDNSVDFDGEIRKLPSTHKARIGGIEDNAILTVYHPNANRPPTLVRFKHYGQGRDDSEEPIPPRDDPWHPFSTRLDFELAELATEARLNRSQVTRLIHIVNAAASGETSSFSIQSFPELEDAWDRASHLQSLPVRDTITLQYKNEQYTYQLHSRPLLPWALNELLNPSLIPYTFWDAQQLFKYDAASRQWARFVNEPFTADRWWQIQSQLPPGPENKLLCFVLYADKSRLSSFGTAKAYPVIARIANISRNVRNGEGAGGGCLIGWLPVVHDEASKKKSTLFTNFKRIVWHQSFAKILETITTLSTTGFAFQSADGIQRVLFPVVLILSADYEEQCVMALIRGQRGKCPCPICLVPDEELTDLNTTWPIRTDNQGRDIVRNSALNKTTKDAQLKVLGLRNVDNAFWNVANSSPHRSLSFDPLHANALGLWGRHMWPALQRILIDMGRQAISKVDAQMASLPTWRGLNHFSAVMDTHFSDGSKFEDISKVIIFATHNILTRAASPQGYLLLRCLRSYLDHAIYLSFEQHTAHTIDAGRAALDRFSVILQEYSVKYPDKSWAFPKLHAQQHAYDDILAKGVTANFSTKPNEKCHKPYRVTYEQQTNFKDVAPQILRVDHRLLVAKIIRQHVDERDKYRKEAKEKSTERQFLNVYVGAVDRRATTFDAVERAHPADGAFTRLRFKLVELINSRFPRNDKVYHTIPGTCELEQARFLKVDYQSLVTWRTATDYLRCTPSFHGHPRYDGVILDDGDGQVAFGILRLIFLVQIDHIDPKAQPFILFSPLRMRSRRTRHKELGLYPLKVQPRASSKVIPARSVIRGCYLVPDNDDAETFFACDTVDTDIFVRLQAIFPHDS